MSEGGKLTFMQQRVLEMSKRDPARQAIIRAYLNRMGKL